MAILAEDQIKTIVKETVREALLHLGYNVAAPEDIIEIQKDKHYLRAQRLRSEATLNNAWFRVVGVVVTAVFAAALLGTAKFLGIAQ